MMLAREAMMGKRGSLTATVAALFVTVGSFTNAAQALSVGQAITAIADRLKADQTKEGVHTGSWPQETWFTGAIAAGMADAYEVTGRTAYKASAELGGNYIVGQSQGNLYDSEVLALTRLSAIAKDPTDNVWRSAASSFYKAVKYDFEGGTNAYISSYAGLDPSIVVSYLANHVLAADYVGAADGKIWRQGLISWLAHVDDSCVFPVMALGAATSALAQTGPLDETLIDPFGNGARYWNMKTLKDLPGLLLSHQVPAGQPGAGGFYWRFDHADGGSAESQAWGYTEDTIFGTLGLIAASKSGSEDDPNLVQAILSAREVLTTGVSPDGVVFELLSQEGSIYYVYAGEMLTVLSELQLCFASDSSLKARPLDHLTDWDDESQLLWAAPAKEDLTHFGNGRSVAPGDLQLQRRATNVESIEGSMPASGNIRLLTD
jgi:hypothetical protein